MNNYHYSKEMMQAYQAFLFRLAREQTEGKPTGKPFHAAARRRMELEMTDAGKGGVRQE